MTSCILYAWSRAVLSAALEHSISGGRQDALWRARVPILVALAQARGRIWLLRCFQYWMSISRELLWELQAETRLKVRALELQRRSVASKLVAPSVVSKLVDCHNGVFARLYFSVWQSVTGRPVHVHCGVCGADGYARPDGAPLASRAPLSRKPYGWPLHNYPTSSLELTPSGKARSASQGRITGALTNGAAKHARAALASGSVSKSVRLPLHTTHSSPKAIAA